MRSFLRSIPVALLIAIVTAPGTAPAEPSASKRQVILELLEVAGGGKMAEQMSQVMLASIRQNQASMVEQFLASEKSLSPEDEARVRAYLSQRDRISQKFAERLPERLDFQALLETVYVPLYDKYFSEEELRAIVAFYRTPAGAKSISAMPRVMQEGMAATLPLIQPVMASLAQEILAEEQAAALQQAPVTPRRGPTP